MSNDSIPPNLEILKMAREIVHNEYIDAKAQLHNKWLVEADLLWRTTRSRLVYPSFPPYPTEDVIVARAKVLLGFLSTQEAPIEPPKEQEPPAVEDQPAEPPTVEEQIVETQPLQEQKPLSSIPEVENKSQPSYTEGIKELRGEELEKAVDKNLEEYSRAIIARRSEEETASSTRLLPSLLKRIDEMKKNWT